MNSLIGKITSVKSDERMSVIEMDVNGNVFKTIIIETPETVTFLKEGHPVNLMFKESEVSIGKNLSGGISLQNRILCMIKEIKSGKLLSKITLECKGSTINSIITAAAAVQLELKVNDEVLALIKTNEIIVAPL